ncbi:DUF4181 domain-containing protein [Mesobacillus subterraneus]|uniref:DUF4181 domain-containing protein n=1 Tax=Mesobacillus subterraneus TaxID=285983 RepID=UPI00203CB59F|nr:DUF4181 domain-containing protein [Mesobacillus subterraneus]MCM3575741.1 DUF4181 domain-containing protein [Mesobacillus subterraneus]
MGLLVLLIVLIGTIVWLMKFLLRKALNIPKVIRKVFSYNHINKTHRNFEWILRITTLIAYLILFYQLIYENFSVNLFLLIMTLLFTAQSFLRAYFEWKASDQPKESILSIAEGVLLIGFVLLIIQFDVLYSLAP